MNDFSIITSILLYKAFVICATLWAVTNINGWWAFLVIFAFIGYSSSNHEEM